jgi:hypothetical protein
MSNYVAGLWYLKESELVPAESTPITADDDDEAVRKAIQWRMTAATTIDGRTWLQVFRVGESKAFHAKEIGRL